MKYVEVYVLGVSESRWEGMGHLVSDDHRLIFAGKEKRGSSGAATIPQGKWKSNVINTYHVNVEC